MTINELLKFGRETLVGSGIENGDNEARWLLENDLKINSARLITDSDESVTDDTARLYRAHIEQRASGKPLQYIFGSWDFYGRDFEVGDGVLIPRVETEALVDYALDFLKDILNPVVIDLCSGTGCIGLTVALERPDSRVVLVEKYRGAIEYLRKNRQKLGAENTVIIEADVLKPDELTLPKADLLLSNPPYVKKDEIPLLQKELQYEPITALDGGEDGLVFYRAIDSLRKRLGNIPTAVECGDTQADEIAKVFGGGRVIKDFADLPRLVVTEGECK